GAEIIAVTDSRYDPALQANDVETVMAEEPELIYTWLVDPVQGAQAFRPAVDAGVKVAFMSNLPEGFQHPEDYASVVTDDLFRMGEAAAEMMAEALGGEGQIGWIFHDADAYVTNQRDQAFKQVIEERYPDIEIVAEGGFAEPQQTFDITQSMLLRNPDIDGIYAPWAVPAASVVEALRAEGRDDVKVVTLDLDPTVAVDMAEGGNVVGIVADVPFEIGRAMGAAALLALVGKESPPFAIVPTMKVTRENLVTAWQESLKEDPPEEVLEALES
ncbi:MAG TPA: substrate-binding domain-containing protein, partial [Acidimicrobiia bacterium]|nr:substrate-binding domain-containing protein [Acidimicrobiia bacterium]